MTVSYPNPFYIKVCYKGIAMYSVTELEFSNVRQLLLLRLATWKFIVENKFMTCVCSIEAIDSLHAWSFGSRSGSKFCPSWSRSVIQLHDLIHWTWYSTPDQVTIIIMCMHCLSWPFSQATSVQNFRTFTIYIVCSSSFVGSAVAQW